MPALPSPTSLRKSEEGTAVVQQFQRGQSTLSFLETSIDSDVASSPGRAWGHGEEPKYTTRAFPGRASSSRSQVLIGLTPRTVTRYHKQKYSLRPGNPTPTVQSQETHICSNKGTSSSVYREGTSGTPEATLPHTGASASIPHTPPVFPQLESS